MGEFDSTEDLLERLNTKRKTKPEPILSKVDQKKEEFDYVLSFNHICRTEGAILTLNGIKLLSIGNLCTIVAPPGTGKSHLCEAVVSKFLNPFIEAFGFGITIQDGLYVLYIDSERTHDDCFKGLKRISERIRIENNKGLIDTESQTFRHLIFSSFIGIGNIDNRRKRIEYYLTKYPIGLLIIDGVTDFIKETNSETEAKEFFTWLIALANTHNFGVIQTIHDNPKTNAAKPRGHIGSEAYRKTESMLLLKKAEDKETRILTTNFEFGKNRNDSDQVETYFKWDRELRMFVSCQYTPPERGNKADSIDGFLSKVFDTIEGAITQTELARKYVELTKSSLPTANRHIKRAYELGFINKDHKGMYYKETPF